MNEASATDLAAEAHLRDWSIIPQELLRLISERVVEIGDYFRFGAVCKHWLSAAPAASLPPQTPLLLLPYNPANTLRRFRSLSTGRIYRFDLPIFRGRVIYPSPHGWLLLVDSSLAVSLFNPITEAHTRLPPPTISVSEVFTRITSVCCQKLTFMPAGFKFFQFSEHFVALITVDRQFLYWDDVWMKPRLASRSPVHTVMYHGSRFYIVHKNGDVAACERGPHAQLKLLPSLKVPVDFDYCYLVQLDGEQLLVTRFFEMVEGRWRFECYKLDVDGELKWAKIDDIGQHALFLTLGVNVIVAGAGEGSGCRRNCIYFYGVLERALTARRLNVAPGLNVVGVQEAVQRLYVVGVQDGKVEWVPDFNEKFGQKEVKSTWFMPTLC